MGVKWWFRRASRVTTSWATPDGPTGPRYAAPAPRSLWRSLAGERPAPQRLKGKKCERGFKPPGLAMRGTSR